MIMVGIGLDLIDLPRFNLLYGGEAKADLERCFTKREIADAGDGHDRLERLAGRFAAKEAVLKLIGGVQDGMSLTDVEVIREQSGPPTILLVGLAAQRAFEAKISRIHISITHSATAAAAVAVGLAEPAAM